MKRIIFIILWLSFLKSLHSLPYVDNGNGTISDIATGLIWQKCSAGQNSTACTGTAINMTWVNAISQCENLALAGRSDWRLPNVNEIRSIIDFSKTSGVTIDVNIFPNTVNSFYWSSTTYGQSNDKVYSAFFNDAFIHLFSKTEVHYVRCVTGP